MSEMKLRWNVGHSSRLALTMGTDMLVVCTLQLTPTPCSSTSKLLQQPSVDLAIHEIFLRIWHTVHTISLHK